MLSLREILEVVGGFLLMVIGGMLLFMAALLAIVLIVPVLGVAVICFACAPERFWL